MEFKELQNKITLALARYGSDNGIRVDDEYVLVKLFEEMGDIAKTALIYKNKCENRKMIPRDEAKKMIAVEIADTVGLLLAFASQLNIDVEEEIKDKWLSKYAEA
ncbi:MAG: hypothetical protein HGB08_01525 [Candidatus Moranbacteria bacterium]|nr:hypothetical protein [Candidatus Moranbacteria bacterium]